MRATVHDQSIVRNDEGQIIINLGTTSVPSMNGVSRASRTRSRFPRSLPAITLGGRIAPSIGSATASSSTSTMTKASTTLVRLPLAGRHQPHDLKLWGTKDLATAWSSDDFGIAVRLDTEGSDLIPELLEAFQAWDVLIFQSVP